MIKYIEIETSLGNIVELEIDTIYDAPSYGGSYEGREWEQISESYSIDRIYRNGIDVTDRLKRFCKGIEKVIDEKINQN